MTARRDKNYVAATVDSEVAMARSRPDDNVIALPERRDDLFDVVEREWVRLISELSSVKEASEGTGGSGAASPATAFTVAERVRILTQATDFLMKLQKLRPSRSRSGIADLSSQHRDNSAGSRPRRG